MAFRTIIITTHSKLEYSLNYLIYRTIEDTKRINLDEIHTIIVESTAVSITSALMVELINRKIKVLFCDEKKNPSFELSPYYGDSISTRRIQEQISWNKETKDLIWQAIVKEKINNQAKNIIDNSDIYSMMIEFKNDVQVGDVTNREGHSAKIYFNNVFGKSFTRGDNSSINIFLNYGYTVLLSQFNKCITSKGYLTQIGIHHKNDFNQFNLSCDLIEPFRAIVDAKAKIVDDKNFKDEMINLLNIKVTINGEQQFLYNAISIYCSSVFRALNNNDLNEISFFTNYEL